MLPALATRFWLYLLLPFLANSPKNEICEKFYRGKAIVAFRGETAFRRRGVAVPSDSYKDINDAIEMNADGIS